MTISSAYLKQVSRLNYVWTPSSAIALDDAAWKELFNSGQAITKQNIAKLWLWVLSKSSQWSEWLLNEYAFYIVIEKHKDWIIECANYIESEFFTLENLGLSYAMLAKTYGKDKSPSLRSLLWYGAISDQLTFLDTVDDGELVETLNIDPILCIKLWELCASQQKSIHYRSKLVNIVVGDGNKSLSSLHFISEYLPTELVQWFKIGTGLISAKGSNLGDLVENDLTVLADFLHKQPPELSVPVLCSLVDRCIKYRFYTGKNLLTYAGLIGEITTENAFTVLQRWLPRFTKEWEISRALDLSIDEAKKLIMSQYTNKSGDTCAGVLPVNLVDTGV